MNCVNCGHEIVRVGGKWLHGSGTGIYCFVTVKRHGLCGCSKPEPMAVKK